MLVTFSIGTSGNCMAETVREGNTFKAAKTTTVSKDTQTPFTWEDKEGKQYPIFETKNHAFYVVKVSKKSGKEYRYYLPREVQAEIRKELKTEKP